MPLPRRLLWLFSILFCCASLRAQTTFSTIVVFGDSLSDTGNVAHVTQSEFLIRFPADNPLLGFDYTDGRFTDGKDTQPAASAYFGVWAEQLAASLPGKPAVKDSLDGGTNYAYGDATTEDGTRTLSATLGGVPVSITIENMGQQVTDYLATNPTPNAQTLYILWGGANDLYADDSPAGVTAAVQREIALIQRLMAVGATNFMVPNLPPLGGVPDFAGSGSSAALNAASESFAVQLAAGLATLQMNAAAMSQTLNIYPIDVFDLFATVAGNPMALGFGNISAAAQNVSGSPDDYLIWDGLHPTTTGHHFLAAEAANLLKPLVVSGTALTVPPAALAGQPVTLKAVVASTASTAAPTGGVTFFNGSTALASAPLDATGTATATLSGATAAASPYTITAVYQGDTTFKPSPSAESSFTVLASAVSTTTTLVSSNLSANFGAPVTFTATVSPSQLDYGTPSGTVYFFDGANGIGSGTLSNGSATFTTSTLTSGSHTITAQYDASGVFAESPISNAVTQVIATPEVTAVATPTSLTISSGGSGTATITATSVGGFSGTLSLACGNLPNGLACSFSTPSLTLSSTNLSASSTLTVGTNGTAMLSPAAHPGDLSVPRVMAAALFAPALAGLLLTGFGGRRMRRSFAGRGIRLMLLVVLFSSALLGMTGCGSSGSSTNATAGNYVVQVLLTSPTGTGTSVSFLVVVQ